MYKSKDDAIACNEDRGGGGFLTNHKYREEYINIYLYTYNYVKMLYYIGIIKHGTSQNRALAEVGRSTRKKRWGAFKVGRNNKISV